MLCLEELSAILFNVFKLCLAFVAPGRTSAFLTVWTTYLCDDNRKNFGYSPDLSDLEKEIYAIRQFISNCDLVFYPTNSKLVSTLEMNAPHSKS